MENCSKEEIQINVTLERPPRFKAGADISKNVNREEDGKHRPRFKAGSDLSNRVNSVEASVKRRPRFKAGSELSGKVNLTINVDHETIAEEEILTLSLQLSEEALEVPDTEA